MHWKHLFALVGLSLASISPASAQSKFQMLGPNECLNCHDHEPERDWYQKKEIPEVRRLFPDRSEKAGHINSLNQLETPKSDEFAKAIGQSDKYDVNGKCVSCHATVFRGDANAGVSCESCHGPGSGYLKPHQTKDAYEVSVNEHGMTRLVGNIQGWTQQCTNCHVMDDERLIKAGHPSGDDFDLSRKYLPVSLHFKKKYSEADVAAIARPQMEAILRYRRSGGAAAPTPESPGATTQAVTPAPTNASAVTEATAAPKEAQRPTTQSVRAVVDAAPGSPTSIEPRFPVASTAASPVPPTVAAPAAQPEVPARASLPPAEEPIQTSTLLLGGIGLLAVAGALWWFLGRGR